jgi:broad specificity phosphatase PhoE
MGTRVGDNDALCSQQRSTQVSEPHRLRPTRKSSVPRLWYLCIVDIGGELSVPPGDGHIRLTNGRATDDIAGMTAIYLLRHGEADYQPVRERQWPGSMADLAPLSARGAGQAAAAAELLACVGATKLVSSPFTRAVQTAAAVSCRTGLAVEVEFDLHEWLPDDTFGWQTHEDVLAMVADFDRHDGEWPPGGRLPWEPLSVVRRRAAAALRRAVAAVPDSGALISVCHEMVIRAVTGEPKTPTGEFRRIESADLP